MIGTAHWQPDMLSIIIPTLNEQAGIAHLLTGIRKQSLKDLEVIVADGGSQDGTPEIARAHGATITSSEPGRGIQLNRGASAAAGEHLLFLHVDSAFTGNRQLEDALRVLQDQQADTAAHFAIEFVSEDPQVLARLQFFAAKTRLNRPGTFNGDQGLLIRAETFHLLGGFSERYPFLEDQDFGERFNDYGAFITLPGPLRTSARRFEREGIDERILLNTIIMGMFHLRRDDFFKAASGVYQADADGHLDPLPFLHLARRSIMGDGVLTGLARCYRLGRYANRNFWQLFFRAGLRFGEPDIWLKNYDRYVRPVTWNPPGDAIATLAVVVWFFAWLFRLSRRKAKKVARRW